LEDENNVINYNFKDENEKSNYIARNRDKNPCDYDRFFGISIHSKGQSLKCYRCDGAWLPVISLVENKQNFDGKINTILSNAKIIDEQKINFPNVQNARIITYQPNIAVNLPYTIKDFNFDYKGKNYLYGINFKNGESGNFTNRSNYDPNSNYDELLMDAISNLEVELVVEMPYKAGEITCGDFTLNFDANKLQVGILDGLSRKFTEADLSNSKFSDPNKDPKFINYTKESRTCGDERLKAQLYPAKYQLPCFGCGTEVFPIVLSQYEDENEPKLEFFKVQNINKPFIQNAQIRELIGDGRGMNKHHSLQFVFDYRGIKYSLSDAYSFVLEDITKEEVAKIITDFEKIVEDFEVKGEKGKNIWGKYIPQVSTLKCGDFGIRYDPAKYQLGLSDDNILAEGNPYDETRYIAFSNYVTKSRTCDGEFGGLYKIGSKPLCWQCDSVILPSITLTESPEPKNHTPEDGSGLNIKVTSSKTLAKKNLDNAKIIEYEFQSYSRPKETYSTLSFDYKGKHYLLQLQESRGKAGSDFKNSNEYDTIFQGLVDSFEIIT
jgi:hypothetical protein